MKRQELDDKAARSGLLVQHECGGFRLVSEEGVGRRDVFPADGVCRVSTARSLSDFLDGIEYAEKQHRRKKG